MLLSETAVVIPKLSKFLKDYNELKGFFKDFVEQIKNGIKKKEEISPFLGMKIEVTLDQDYFKVEYAGRTIEFLFTFQYDENKEPVGKVECFIRTNSEKYLSSTLNPYMKVDQFTYNQKGKTDMELLETESSRHEPIFFTEITNYYIIFLNFMNEALSK
jgi:hypothetical protein